MFKFYELISKENGSNVYEDTLYIFWFFDWLDKADIKDRDIFPLPF